MKFSMFVIVASVLFLIYTGRASASSWQWNGVCYPNETDAMNAFATQNWYATYPVTPHAYLVCKDYLQSISVDAAGLITFTLRWQYSRYGGTKCVSNIYPVFTYQLIACPSLPSGSSRSHKDHFKRGHI